METAVTPVGDGRYAYLVQRKADCSWETIGTITHEGSDWVLRYSSSARSHRYWTLARATEAAVH
jgi:hypothetical protein